MNRWLFQCSVLLLIPGPLTAIAQTPTEVAGALAQGQVEHAIELADAALKERPHDPQMWTLRGAALARFREASKSLASFEQALANSPNYLPALQGAAQESYQLHSPEATGFLQRIIASDPTNQTAHAMLGGLAAESHDCRNAIKEFGEASSVIEGNADALMQYGSCQLSEGYAQEATKTLGRLIQLRPDDLSARYKLAVSLGGLHRTAEALALLKTLPPNSEVLNLSAEYYEREKDPKSAETALRQAIKAAPSEEQNYVDLGRLYIELRQPEKAVEVESEALNHIQSSARLYTMRGAAYTWLNDPEEAARDFERAEQLEPDQLYGSIGLSMLRRQDQRLPEAISILRSKVAERPNDATLNYLLADTMIRTGAAPGQALFEEAVSLFKKALLLQPGFQKARVSLGKAYLRAAKPADAEREFREAVRTDPRDRSALTQLVLLLRRNGKAEEAGMWAAKLKELVITAEADPPRK